MSDEKKNFPEMENDDLFEGLTEEDLRVEKPDLERLMREYLDGTLIIEEDEEEPEEPEQDFLDFLGIQLQKLDEEKEKMDAMAPSVQKTERSIQMEKKPLYVPGDTNILFHDIDVSEWPDPDLIDDEEYFIAKSRETAETKLAEEASRQEKESPEQKETPESEKMPASEATTTDAAVQLTDVPASEATATSETVEETPNGEASATSENAEETPASEAAETTTVVAAEMTDVSVEEAPATGENTEETPAGETIETTTVVAAEMTDVSVEEAPVASESVEATEETPASEAAETTTVVEAKTTDMSAVEAPATSETAEETPAGEASATSENTEEMPAGEAAEATEEAPVSESNEAADIDLAPTTVPDTQAPTDTPEAIEAPESTETPEPSGAPDPIQNTTESKEQTEMGNTNQTEETDGLEYMTEAEKADDAAYQRRREARKKAAEVKQQQNGLVKEIISWILPMVIAVSFVLLLKTFVIIMARVPSGSMENTIMTGDMLVGNRLAYINSEPERGDIIIFKFPDDESQKYIKRVIGLPGETVEIRDAKVYINGSETPLEEDYLKEEWYVAADGFTFEVPEDCYFVMGDNRNRSADARYWTNTYVARDKIIAKAVWIWFPFSHVGSLTN